MLSYEAEYKAQLQTNWKQFYSGSLTNANLRDDIQPDTEYQVRVRTIASKGKREGKGLWSEPPVVFRTKPLPAAPPHNIKADALGSTVVRVEWDAAPTPADGVLSYEAEYKTQTESEWTPFYRDTLTSAILNNLQHSTNYEVRVRVVTGKAESAWEVVHTSTPPAPPSIAIDTVASTTVKFTLTVSDDGVSSYEIEYKTQAETEWTSLGKPNPPSLPEKPGTRYRLRSTCASKNRQRRKCLGE